MASQMVAGNLSLGRLEKGVFRLLCFLLFRYERGLKTVCVCVQQGAEFAHLNSQFRLCLGVALTTSKTKGACVHNLLLGCFLLMMEPGPATSSYSTWMGLCKRHKAGNAQELLCASPNHFISWRIDLKRPSQETWPGAASHTICTHGFRHLWNL